MSTGEQTIPVTVEDADPSDIASLALCAWKEARGEGLEGIIAVMHVIGNRAVAGRRKGFASTIHGVIYGKNQFTSMSVPSDPEFNLIPEPDDPTYEQCVGYAKQMLSAGAVLDDPTKNALYYANLHNIPTDGWFYRNIVLNTQMHPITAQIGKHTFFA